MSRPLVLAALSAFMISLGLGVLFPVLPFFTEALGLSKLEYSWIMGIHPVVVVLVSPFWGRFSERRGRRPAIVIGLIGFGLSFLAFSMGQTFTQLLVIRFLGGLFSAATLPAVFAYVADVTQPEDRSAAMGLIGASIGTGFMIGPLMGGLLGALGGELGLRSPYVASGLIGLISAAVIYSTLPESLDEKVRTEARAHREWLAGRGVTGTRIAGALWPYLVVSFLAVAARLGMDVTLGFLAADRLGATQFGVGMLLFGMSATMVYIQARAIRPLSARFGEHAVMLVGMGAMAAGLIATGFAWSWRGLGLAGLTIAVGFALLTPTFNALLSHAAEGIHGEAQGLNNSAQSSARIFGALVFPSLYELASWGPYVVAGVLCLIALAVGGLKLRDNEPVLSVVEGQTA